MVKQETHAGSNPVPATNFAKSETKLKIGYIIINKKQHNDLD
jgi:hypothetical protein